MHRRVLITGLVLLIFGVFGFANDHYLKIDTNVNPKTIKQGYEGVLKIKITPKDGIKISSHPEFIIKLNDNQNVTFSKKFFTATELDYQTTQENGTIFLELEKEVPIPFKVNENSLRGKLIISGEVVFTAVTADNWSLKTYQKFNADLRSKQNLNSKKK